MEDKTFYITTPIYYPSDKLHIGNTYCTVAVDVVARYKKLRGYDVKFLTGTDDHGIKIERIAKESGVTPLEYVDKIVEMTRELWDVMNCEYDVFMRTSDPAHVKIVQAIFKKLYEKGDIYKGYYEGQYCVPCETYFTKTQSPDGICADCGRPLESVKEETYFFRQSKYREILLKHIEENPDFIKPESRKNEMVNNFLKGNLEDIAISRTTFTWGVPVDFDPGHVVYVWFDALPNYITALGYLSENNSEYKKYWPANIHMVGKDILRFHTILWPAMLLALGEPLPKTIFGTGWLLIDGGKMSKSKNNVIDPIPLVQKYSVDSVRYFLMREVVLGQDGNYTEEALAIRINSDLANDLGNLLSRTIGMIDKYFAGTLPEIHENTDFDQNLIQIAENTIKSTEKYMDNLEISEALSEIWVMIRRANKYVDETQPWILAKDESNKAKLARVLYMLSEVLRCSAILISPVMPNTSKEIFRQLNVIDENLKSWESLKSFETLPKAVNTSKGETLFPRIDLKAAFGEKEKPVQPEKLPEITIDDFSKLELKVGEIIKCEKITEKLLKSQVKIGDDTRQIVSGIAAYYSPDEMIGKKVVVVCNLKPIKLRGHISEGMILAANANSLKVVTVDGDIESGAVVS